MEEEACLICFDGDCYENNTIVFCDSCSIPIHQMCYGIPHLPAENDPWFCAPCANKQPSESISCKLCLQSGGALKHVARSDEYAHVICAHWIPEIRMVNERVNLSGLLSERKNLKCSLCQIRGICIQCNYGNCPRSFHPYCAMHSDTSQVSTGYMPTGDLRIFCKWHAEKADELFIPMHPSEKNRTSEKVSCPSCKMMILKPLLPYHFDHCPKRVQRKSKVKGNNNTTSRRHSEPPPVIKLKCKTCRESMSKENLDDHEATCTGTKPRFQNYVEMEDTEDDCSEVEEGHAKATTKGKPKTKFVEMERSIMPSLESHIVGSSDWWTSVHDEYFHFKFHTKRGCSTLSTVLKSALGVNVCLAEWNAPCSLPAEDECMSGCVLISPGKSRMKLKPPHALNTVALSEIIISDTLLQLRLEDGSRLFATVELVKDIDSEQNTTMMTTIMAKKEPVNADGIINDIMESLLFEVEKRIVNDDDNIDKRVSSMMENMNNTNLLNSTRMRLLWENCDAKWTEGVQKTTRRLQTEAFYKAITGWKTICSNLEKGFTDKPLSVKPSKKTVDDGTCRVCYDGQSSEFNTIIFCDTCNVAVHQFCYGVSTIPSTAFHCDYCISKSSRKSQLFTPALCSLCSVRGGAVKKTSCGQWVHVTCAVISPNVWIQDTGKLDRIHLKPQPTSDVVLSLDAAIDNMHSTVQIQAPAFREVKKCSCCGIEKGTCIPCAADGCNKSFHVLCGWYSGLFTKVSVHANTGLDVNVSCTFYCFIHTPRAVHNNRKVQADIRATYHLRQPLQEKQINGKGALLKKAVNKPKKGSKTTKTIRRRPKVSLPFDHYAIDACAICMVGKPHALNAVLEDVIVCVSCKVPVHSSCAGLKTTSSTTWRCSYCRRGHSSPCALCPRRGGFFVKLATPGSGAACDTWVHAFCLLQCEGATREEKVQSGREAVHYSLFNERQCGICAQGSGLMVPCTDRTCSVLVHPLCALLSHCPFTLDENALPSWSCLVHRPSGIMFNARLRRWMNFKELKELRKLRIALEETRVLIDLSKRCNKLKKWNMTAETKLFRAASSVLTSTKPSEMERQVYTLVSQGDLLDDIEVRISRTRKTKTRRQSAPPVISLRSPRLRNGTRPNHTTIQVPIQDTKEGDMSKACMTRVMDVLKSTVVKEGDWEHEIPTLYPDIAQLRRGKRRKCK